MVLCSNSEDLEWKLMVDDVYDILTAVSVAPEGRVALCANHAVSALCKAVANNCYRMFVVFLPFLSAYYELSRALCVYVI